MTDEHNVRKENLSRAFTKAGGPRQAGRSSPRFGEWNLIFAVDFLPGNDPFPWIQGGRTCV